MKFPYRTFIISRELYHKCEHCNENPVLLWSKICKACFDTSIFSRAFKFMKYIEYIDTYWPARAEVT